MEWSTVVGNRVNCTGTCWSFVSVPLGTATATANGSLSGAITIPDGLGGWHVVQLLQGGQVKAQVPYYVKRSIFGKGVSSLTLKEGAAVHRAPQGTRLDAARQHDRGRLRQQLRRLRLRFQQQRRHGHEPGGDGRTRHAPDRHVPAALYAAAVVSEHTVRHGPRPDLRAGRARGSRSATSCRRCASRSPSSSKRGQPREEPRAPPSLPHAFESCTRASRATRAGSHQL